MHHGILMLVKRKAAVGLMFVFTSISVHMTVMAWTDRDVIKNSRADIQQELNKIQGLIVTDYGNLQT